MQLYRSTVAKISEMAKGAVLDARGEVVGRVKGEPRRQLKKLLQKFTKAEIYTLDARATKYLFDLVHAAKADSDGRAPRWMEDTRHIQSNVAWIEFEYDRSGDDPYLLGTSSPSGNRGRAGFIVDNRFDGWITTKVVLDADDDLEVIVPTLELRCRKDADGRINYEDFRLFNDIQREENSKRATYPAGAFDAGELKIVETAKAMLAVAFALHAEMRAEDDGLVLRKADIEKTPATRGPGARRSSLPKSAEKSFVTVRVGPAGERHLAEVAARHRHAATASDRHGPVEHWVSTHERRLADGRIVLVRGHKRGKPIEAGVPVRVLGPEPA